MKRFKRYKDFKGDKKGGMVFSSSWFGEVRGYFCGKIVKKSFV